MRVLVVFFVVVSCAWVSGCSTVTDQDVSDLRSPNAIVVKEAVDRIARGPAFPVNMMGPLARRGNETKAMSIMIEVLDGDQVSKDVELSLLKALGDLGKRTEVPAAPLIKKLKDRDAHVRCCAIEALGKMRSKEALPALIRSLEQETDRYPAIWALGEIGDYGAIPDLEQFLAGDDKYATYNAYTALAKIGMSKENYAGRPVATASAGASGPPHPQPSRRPAETVAMGQTTPVDRPGSGKSPVPGSDYQAPDAQSLQAENTQKSPAPPRPMRETQHTQQTKRHSVKKPGPGKDKTILSQAFLNSQDLHAAKAPADEAPPSPKQKTLEKKKPGQSPAMKPKPEPEKSTLLCNKALALQRQGALQEAKQLYEDALTSSPNLVGALNNIGVIYMTEKNYGAARGVFERAIKTEPDHVDPYYNLACLYALQKDRDQSLSYLKKAVVVDEAARMWARTDGDLINLHGHAEYEEIVHDTKGPESDSASSE
jgi:tetratricopeptide (TPR) repeat protein